MEDATALIHAYLDGTASAEERSRLNEWINADPAHAREFAEFSLLHDQLRNEYASRQALLESGEHPVLRPAVAPPPGRNRLVGVAVACSLVAVLSAMWLLTRGPEEADVVPAPAFARVTNVSGQVRIASAGGKGLTPQSGVRFEAGATVETTGPASFVELAFDDGTRLLVAGSATLICTSIHPKHLTVARGSILASVQPQPDGQPMMLRTPLARVEVLGTEFNLAATDAITDLLVSEGRVRLTQEKSGQSRVIDQGERAVARVTSPDVEVSTAPAQSDTWLADYEDGLPASCVLGRWTSADLPAGSRGAARDAPSDADSNAYAIDHNDWLNGLFRVYDDSHLHMVFRMEQPDWINIFLLTRADDPCTSDVQLHMCTQSPRPTAGKWHKAVIPLSTFMRKVDGRFTDLPPKNDQLCFGLLWSWVHGPREMTIDRAWITRGGPGRVILERLEENSTPVAAEADNGQGP